MYGIKGELQTWNEYYEQEQETGVEMPNIPTMSSPMTFAAPTLMNDNPSSTPSLPVSTAPMPIPETTVQQSGAVPAGSSNVNVESNPIPPLGELPPLVMGDFTLCRKANRRKKGIIWLCVPR